MSQELKKRTRTFAVRIIRLCEALPQGRTSDVIGEQLLRCGTSVGALYRAATRMRSQADYIDRMCLVEDACDESLYWMQLLIDLELVAEKRLAELMREAQELVAITASSIRTARAKQNATGGSQESTEREIQTGPEQGERDD